MAESWKINKVYNADGTLQAIPAIIVGSDGGSSSGGFFEGLEAHEIEIGKYYSIDVSSQEPVLFGMDFSLKFINEDSSHFVSMAVKKYLAVDYGENNGAPEINVEHFYTSNLAVSFNYDVGKKKVEFYFYNMDPRLTVTGKADVYCNLPISLKEE
ncbi:hypothetical protein LJB88_02160 [Erysipelotrichaceae bacterium OttesenSCG-928-M19]|nr:hypothetical protein [Erysipelotrichaceae bacterium OttesenSCG-928-M19]